MVVFLSIYFIILLFSVSSKNICKAQILFLYVLYSLVSLLLIVYTPLFSAHYSRDYTNYKKFYLINNSKYQIEYIYFIIKNILHNYNLGEYFFFFIISILGIGVLFKITWKESQYPLISIFLYLSRFYFVDGATTIRAGIASAFFLVAIYYYKNNNKIIAFFVCVISTLFHNIGLLSFALFFLNKNKIHIWFWSFVIVFSFLFAQLNLMEVFENVLLKLPLPSSVGGKLSTYIALSKVIKTYSVNLFSIGNIIQLFFIFVFLCSKKMKSNNNLIEFKIYILSYVFLCAFSKFDTIPFRINQFLSISEIILLPNCINAYRTKERKLIIYIVCLLYGVFRLAMHFRSETLYLL